MKEKSIIYDLYDHFDELSFGLRPSGKKYDKRVNELNDAYEKLHEAMSDDVRKLFEAYEEAESSVQYLTEKEIFRQGVCFGVRFTSESFLMDQIKSLAIADK